MGTGRSRQFGCAGVLGDDDASGGEVSHIEQDSAEDAGKGQGCSSLQGKIAKGGHLGFSFDLNGSFLCLGALDIMSMALYRRVIPIGHGEIGSR
ncbi:MAG: hypothetical protein DHS20C04_23440 [Hyphococcus sp.]|nr:MAG: hypothetical protein DHS20C04_23440 [Marinicaulis sp.]